MNRILDSNDRLLSEVHYAMDVFENVVNDPLKPLKEGDLEICKQMLNVYQQFELVLLADQRIVSERYYRRYQQQEANPAETNPAETNPAETKAETKVEAWVKAEVDEKQTAKKPAKKKAK